MPDAGLTGFATGFAGSLDTGLSLGMRAKENRERKEERQRAEGRSEQQRIQQERADEAMNSFDSGDPTPVVEAWNKSASAKGLPPEKAATAAEIDPSTGEVVIQHNDGTSTRKKSDQARAMLRAAYGAPARQAISTDAGADEDKAYRFATTSLRTGNFEPVFKALNAQFEQNGGKPFNGFTQTEGGFQLTTHDDKTVDVSMDDAYQLAGEVFGQRVGRRGTAEDADPANTQPDQKPNALQMDVADQHAAEFFSEWIDTTNLDPDESDAMLSRFIKVMRDPNNKMGAIESMKAMNFPIRKYAQLPDDLKQRHAQRMQAMREAARQPGSPGGEAVTAAEAAEIAAVPKEAAIGREQPKGVRFAIDPNSIPGQPAPAQTQASTAPASGTTMTEQEYRDRAAAAGYDPADIEESVAEYKRQGKLR